MASPLGEKGYAPQEEQEAAKAAAEAAKQAATAARAAVPEGLRSYGVITCGAALGYKAYIAAFLEDQTNRLCNDLDSKSPGSIPSLTEALASESAHCESTISITRFSAEQSTTLGRTSPRRHGPSQPESTKPCARRTRDAPEPTSSSLKAHGRTR